MDFHDFYPFLYCYKATGSTGDLSIRPCIDFLAGLDQPWILLLLKFTPQSKALAPRLITRLR